MKNTLTLTKLLKSQYSHKMKSFFVHSNGVNVLIVKDCFKTINYCGKMNYVSTNFQNLGNKKVFN